MSADATPITPTRFAAALKDLSLSSLHLKVLELRNSLAHLDYSNEQLRPFAAPTTGEPPDPVCIEAIAENEVVIARMQERIALVRAEVEGRGFGWTEFKSREEAEAATEENRVVEAATNGAADAGEAGAGEGEGPEQERHSAWTDGTFQTGVISGGEVRMDAVAGSRSVTPSPPRGGLLTDEELRRRMEEQLRGLGSEDDGGGGVHL